MIKSVATISPAKKPARHPTMTVPTRVCFEDWEGSKPVISLYANKYEVIHSP